VPTRPPPLVFVRDVQAAVELLGLNVIMQEARSAADIEAAFVRFAAQPVDVLVLGSGAFFNLHRDRLVALAASHALPAIYTSPEFAELGGLMSYGADNKDAYRQAGVYVARILKGDKPADLPVMQPTKFELVINMKTVRALGLTVPPGLLAIGPTRACRPIAVSAQRPHFATQSAHFATAPFPHGMIGTEEVEFFGDPSMILSL
jgi:putative ABC transport system substrate-binding protein